MTQEYINENKNRFLNELFEFIKIPSVSADMKFKDDVLKAASFLENNLNQIGADNVQIFPTEGHPIVYADKIIDLSLPTVLVYGHYDVQPADPYELWDSDPFEPVVKKTKIHPEGAVFARGACDDKGQMFMHLKAFIDADDPELTQGAKQRYKDLIVIWSKYKTELDQIMKKHDLKLDGQISFPEFKAMMFDIQDLKAEGVTTK